MSKLAQGVLILLEALTLLALVATIGTFLFSSDMKDELTAFMVLVVLLVWCTYGVVGLGYWSRQTKAPNPGTPSPVGLDLLREARRHVIVVEDGERLPVGLADRLVEDYGDTHAPTGLATGRNVLIVLGLVGTFLGLTLGLMDAAPHLSKLDEDPEDMTKGMEGLLDGAKLAFVKSIAGIWCGTLWGLRYRWIEDRHGDSLHKWREWLDDHLPPVSQQELLQHLLSAQTEAISKLDATLAAAIQSTNAGLGSIGMQATQGVQLLDVLHAGLVNVNTTIGSAASQVTVATTTAGKQQADAIRSATELTSTKIDNLGGLIREFSESLPEDIGQQTSLALGLKLDDLSEALRGLSSAGGAAIGDVLDKSVKGEVATLRESLTEVAALLNGLGPRVAGAIDTAGDRLGAGASKIGEDLARTGAATSADIRGAAEQLHQGVAQLASTLDHVLDNLRVTMEETHTVVSSLRGAGDDVANSLRDVAQPMVGLPGVLQGAHHALGAAAQATDAATTRTEQVAGLLRAAAVEQQAVIEATSGLHQEAQQVRTAWSELSGALAELKDLLDAVGPQLQSAVESGASTFTAAGDETAAKLRAAADDLAGGTELMAEGVKSIRATLAETRSVAQELEGAGTDVASSLQGVATPLLVLPTTLTGLQAAMVEAQQGLTEGASAAQSSANTIATLTRGLSSGREAQAELAVAAGALTEQVDRLRQACEDTVRSLGKAASETGSVSSQSIEELMRAVQDFQTGIAAGLDAMNKMSKTTFNGASAVTQAAAERLAEALAGGADAITNAAAQLARYSAEMDAGLQRAHDTIAAIGQQAEALNQSAANAAGPFQEVANSLSSVGPEVRQATVAVNAERAALVAAGRELQGASEVLRRHIAEYRGLGESLNTEWSQHVRGVDALLDRVQKAWTQAMAAADSGMDRHATQIATYAKRVEDSLSVPNDIRQLEQTLDDLVGVLEDLKEVRR